MGKWTAVNGEAIYGTVPAPECTAQTPGEWECYTTKKANAIYVHVVRWPGGNNPGTIRIRRTGLLKAELLDASLPALQFSSSVDNGTTVVSLKQPAKVDPYATVVKLTFEPGH
jgi:hypothetical protein